MSFYGRVAVENVKATMDVLKQFDPEAEKAIRKRINKAARTIVLDARTSMPAGKALRKWGTWTQNGRDLSYNGNASKIRTTRANMRKRGQIVSNYIGVVNPTPGGAIFELAGRGKNTDQSFLQALYSAGYGIARKGVGTQRPGVFRSFDQNPQAQEDILDALDDAQTQASKILKRMAGGI